jgi:hypothetical protein
MRNENIDSIESILRFCIRRIREEKKTNKRTRENK